MGNRYKPPEGWTLQAFDYAFNADDAQLRLCERSFGARRFVRNWAISEIEGALLAYNMTGISTAAPSLYGLRKQWNRDKHEIAVDGETGEPWWDELSKEVFSDGIRGAVDAYWNWQKSRSGERKGPQMGFPKKHKKNKSKDSFYICQPSKNSQSIRIVDNRTLRVPKIGEVHTHESMRKLARLIERGMARILGVTVKRRGNRLHAVLRVEVLRPQRHRKPTQPHSRVGVDIGQRVLAVVAAPDGTILERVENPKPLTKALAELRRVNRKLSRQKKGSNGWQKTRRTLRRLHHRIACIRTDAIHKLTTRLAKTHGEIVVEDLNSAGMRKGGAKHLRDANFGRFRHHMGYKPDWYGSTVVFADRFFPSSKTCSQCGHIQNIRRKQRWTCEVCETEHDRDDNAAINLARWNLEESGLVGSTLVPAVRSGEVGQPPDRLNLVQPPNGTESVAEQTPKGETPQGVAA